MVSEMSYFWHDHQSAVVREVQNLWESNYFSDCTFAAEGQYIKAHRLIMSASSPYFQMLFSQEQERNPIVILKDVRFQDLKSIIEFVYYGETHVPKDQVNAFFSTAKNLQIRGFNHFSDEESMQQETAVSATSEPEENNSPVSRKRRRIFQMHTSYRENPYNNGMILIDAKNESIDSQCPNTSTSLLRNILVSTASPTHSPIPQVSPEMESDISKDTMNSQPLSFQSGVVSPNNNKANTTSKLELGNFINCVVKSECVDENSDGDFDKNLESYESFGNEQVENETTSDIYDDGSSSNLPVPPIISIDESVEDSRVNMEEDVRSIKKLNTLYSAECKPKPGNEKKFINPSRAPQKSCQLNQPNFDELLPGNFVSASDFSRGEANDSPNDRSAAALWAFALRNPTTVPHPRMQGNETKKHSCSICQKKFSTPFHLKTHIRTHTGEKPFQCHICDARFSQKSNLNSHLHTHNKRGKLISCRFCPMVFISSNLLEQHEQSVHTMSLQN